MNPATYMWTSSCQKYGLANSAWNGCTSTTRPSRSVKPLGWFIHPLTEITISEPVNPAIATGHPVAKCARAESRSQP